MKHLDNQKAEVLTHPRFRKRNFLQKTGDVVVGAAKERPGRFAIAAGGTLVYLGQLLAPHFGGAPVEAEKSPMCVPSKATQEYTFGADEGVNNAILKIKGAGKGEGAVCWDEAEAIVDTAVGDNIPNDGQTITIPKEIYPIEKQDQNK